MPKYLICEVDMLIIPEGLSDEMCKMLIKVPNHEFSERFPIDVVAIFKAVSDPAFPVLSA